MTTPHTLLYVAADPVVGVSPLARVAGLAIAERVLRAAARAGCARAIVYDPWRRLTRLADEIDASVEVVSTPEAWSTAVSALAGWEPVTVVGPGTIASTAFLAAAASLVAPPVGVSEVPAGARWPYSGVLRMRASQALDLDRVLTELRTTLARVVPLPDGTQVMRGEARLVIRIRSPRDLPDAEQTLRDVTFKPTDARIARFNRRISLPISIALLRTPITANHVSMTLVGLGFLAGWLFSRGSYVAGIAAAFISLAASVLDGCDGEIARLKYQESALGCWLETFGDYSYYLAIFVGLTIGVVRHTGMPIFFWLGALGLIGTIMSFALLIYLRSRITAGRPETLHSVARSRFTADPSWWSGLVWRLSFVATRAAMPYGIMALALVDLLPLVVFLSALGANVYWLALVLKLRHLLTPETDAAAAA